MLNLSMKKPGVCRRGESGRTKYRPLNNSREKKHKSQEKSLIGVNVKASCADLALRSQTNYAGVFMQQLIYIANGILIIIADNLLLSWSVAFFFGCCADITLFFSRKKRWQRKYKKGLKTQAKLRTLHNRALIVTEMNQEHAGDYKPRINHSK